MESLKSIESVELVDPRDLEMEAGGPPHHAGGEEGILRRRLTGGKPDPLERETGFEPATLALARRCSTTELFPLNHSQSEGGILLMRERSCQATSRSQTL